MTIDAKHPSDIYTQHKPFIFITHSVIIHTVSG